MPTENQARSSKDSSTDSSTARRWEKPEAPPRGFTEAWIAGLPHGPSRYEVGDPRAPGLCIRVAAEPGKSKSWVWYAVDGGKRRCIVFGRWPTISVDRARRLLEEHKEAKAEGRLGVMVEKAPPAEGAVLVRDLAEDFYRTEIVPRRRHAWHARSILDNYVLPTIGHLEVKTLTTKALRAPTELAVERGNRVHAAAVLQITKAIVRSAASRGEIAYDVGAPLRAKTLGAKTTSKSKRFAGDAELPLLLAGLRRLADPSKTLLRLLLATGVRTEELLGAPWSEFDLEAGVWTIPPQRRKMTLEAEATADEWRVPLAPSVVALLERLKKLPKKKSKWVAASADSKRGRVSDKILSHAMRRLQGLDRATAARAEARAEARKADPTAGKPGPAPGGRAARMALPGGPITAHAFRRTLRNWLLRNGCTEDIGERCLGHKRPGIVDTYGNDDVFDQRKEWMARWAAHLDAVEAATTEGAAE